jgi:hypothetical protein
MIGIGLLLNVGILWFLITLFTRQTNSTVSLGETWIVIIGTVVVGVLSRLLLGGFLGPFVVIVDIMALYLIVDKVCGTPKKTTYRICGWYFGITFFLGVVSYFLSLER